MYVTNSFSEKFIHPRVLSKPAISTLLMFKPGCDVVVNDSEVSQDAVLQSLERFQATHLPEIAAGVAPHSSPPFFNGCKDQLPPIG